MVMKFPAAASDSVAQSLAAQAAQSLHWVNLISGRYFHDRRRHFRRHFRADHLLLGNLRYVRRQLLENARSSPVLDEDTCHDLLARVIFIQFLMDRKDRQGRAALDEQRLAELHDNGVLSSPYSKLSEILRNKKDTYSFFEFLDDKFNGDLFAGNGRSRRRWQAESRKVMKAHLDLLADFIDGKLQMEGGQHCLWPQYSFDVIPLEFISSIYEEFLKEEDQKRGVHYTPAHVVDYLLDGVLPWGGKKWNLSVLDPACGSGIFLVKAYQRLIHRWKNAHRGDKPRAENLRRLLTHNIFGVDINPHAVRVASFGLYLAMCDEIEPMHLWQRVKFPDLRGTRIVCADFFEDDKRGFRTEADAASYDLVVGNVPWGQNVETEPARKWAEKREWPIAYKNAGLLFLPKALALAKKSGRVSMIQPAQALLTNRQPKAMRFRERFFRDFKVEEVTNLSSLRFKLFSRSISPACVVTASPKAPDGEPIMYVCPKPSAHEEDKYMIIIDPSGVGTVSRGDAMNAPEVWSAIMWGGRRDLALARRLSQRSSLVTGIGEEMLTAREGVIRGNRGKRQKKIVDRRYLNVDGVPPDSFLTLDARLLPINQDDRTDARASSDFSAFEVPQLVLKQGWEAGGRFWASIVRPDSTGRGIICSQSFVSVHVPADLAPWLEAACLSYNSIVAVYFLFLTSGRFAGYIPEPLVKEMLSVPVPEPRSGLLDGLRNHRDVDTRIRELFELDDLEWAMIEDMVNITIPDFKGGPNSPGRKVTERGLRPNSSGGLADYCRVLQRVIKSGFGADRGVAATFFEEKTRSLLPVRLVALYLDSPRGNEIAAQSMDCQSILAELSGLYNRLLSMGDVRAGGVFYQRVARIYDSADVDGERVSTVYLVKPDQVRYWTKSAALRDADDISADIVSWRR